MREILFRAKRIDNGKWVEGYVMDENYINVPFNDNDACGRFDDPVEIDPETICQYTGLTDKNGKRIWENDICIIHSSNIDDEDGYFTIAWDEDGARFILDGNLIVDFDNCYGYECEVIGNIFDNPELLKED